MEIIAIGAIVLALIFDFVNGFHDTANAVAKMCIRDSCQESQISVDVPNIFSDSPCIGADGELEAGPLENEIFVRGPGAFGIEANGRQEVVHLQDHILQTIFVLLAPEVLAFQRFFKSNQFG